MTKTLLITGASSGIDAATARAAVAAGYNVELVARSADKLAAIEQELGESAIAIAADVTDFDAQVDAVAQTMQRFGQLDAAFANARRGLETPVTETA